MSLPVPGFTDSVVFRSANAEVFGTDRSHRTGCPGPQWALEVKGAQNTSLSVAIPAIGCGPR